MNPISLKLKFLIIALLICSPCSAQIKDKISKIKLFAELAEDEKSVANCYRKSQEAQISKYGKIIYANISGCWEGCARNIVTPHYPQEARRLNISGQVRIETITDENGDVIYAEIAKGKPFLSQSALKAAYLSKYKSKLNCNGKFIKVRRAFIYNFYL